MITAEIKDIAIDEKGNIKVVTEYRDEENNLIQEGTTRYSRAVLPTDEEIEALIHHDIQAHADVLHVRAFSNTVRANFSQAHNEQSVQSLKSKLLGMKKSVAEGTIRMPHRELKVNKNQIISRKDKNGN